jgi:hypothetical protein
MKTAICAIIKDEHLYLKEWIDWHLYIGFDAIYLLEDKGSKSHENITSEYNNVFLRSYATDIELQECFKIYDHGNQQDRLYFWFSENYKDIYDWVAYIDVDEFINFEDNYTLQNLCEEYIDYPAVLLYWKMMGASGHIKKPKCGVVEAYTNETPLIYGEEGWSYKSFVNLKKYEGFTNLHTACGAIKTNYESNPEERYIGRCFDKAWINHYFTKSWEEWCNRIYKRGGTINGHRTLSQFFEVNTDMEHLRKQLINEISDKIPNGSYWLDKKKLIIAGGNYKEIKKLNRKSFT